MTVTVESATPSAVIDRVSLVLDAFDGPGRLTLAQIVRRTGLPRSSAHRMLERLVQLRWLRRSGRDYELGMRLVELGSLAVHQDRVHRAAMPVLHELHRATGLVVHLAVLDGSDVVYLEKVGDRMMAAIPTRVGGRHPAHCTAVGKAILAESGDDVLTPLNVDLLPRKTKYSISTTSQLRTELNKVRRARRGVRPRRVAGRLRLRRRLDRHSGRRGRRGVGVRSDEPDDVRSATGRSGADGGAGNLAAHRRQCGTSRPDPAADARTAHRPGRPADMTQRQSRRDCSSREPRPRHRGDDRGTRRRLPQSRHNDRS